MTEDEEAFLDMGFALINFMNFMNLFETFIISQGYFQFFSYSKY